MVDVGLDDTPTSTEALLLDASVADKATKTKWDLSHLDEEQRTKLDEVLQRYNHVFSENDLDIGSINDFQMKLNLTDNIPVTASYQKIPPHLYNEVKNYIEDMRTNGWIRESYSSYTSPIVCARKPNGAMRLCIDYRKVNAKTATDAQPIPRIQDILDNLAGARWFSTLDMSKAYHQGFIHEDSRHITAFVTPWTIYEWIRMPFGLKNAPPAFQRYMNQILGEYKGKFCEPYLDDVLCHSRTFDDHVEHLEKVLARLGEKGIKLRAEKCHFAKPEVRYLGRIVTAEGYRPDPKDIAALEKYRTPPKTIGKLRSLLGFVGYYRGYVKDFSRRVKPLYDLLKGKATVEIKGKGGKVGQRYDAKEKIAWEDTHQKILEDLISTLQSNEVIAYPDFTKPFFLNCDASKEGLGAVLYQNQEGIDKVISYASRTLSEAEKNYNMHSGKLEFLALKWSISERFSDYLRWSKVPFQVFTDNNPLTYVLSTAKLNAVGLRWVAELADYDFTMKYKPGKTNIDADYLSRRPTKIEDYKKLCTEIIDRKEFEAITCGVKEPVAVLSGAVAAEKLVWKVNQEVVPVSREEIVAEQQNDETIGVVYQAVLTGERPDRNKWSEWSQGSKILMRSFKKLRIENGMLLRETTRLRQVVLPKKYHKLVYEEFHVKFGHIASEKVLHLSQQRFYWPKMKADIEHFVMKKCKCVINKQPNIKERAPLNPIEAQHPFQMLSIDYLEVDKCKGGYQYILVAVDHFTRYAQFFATKTKSSKAAADKIFQEFVLKFGFPSRIHHDKGQEWNSNMFKELHRLTGINASNTTPYWPQGDGQVERFNRTLINMLKTLANKEKADWRSHLPKLAFAVNSTQNATTGFSPYFLMFGREARLPVD